MDGTRSTRWKDDTRMYIIHVPAVLPSVPVRYAAWWVQELVLTLWKREKFLYPVRNETQIPRFSDMYPDKYTELHYLMVTR
jgi:hypothetical protein